MSELLLIATIAGERVAIAADDIESVVEIGSITPVPRAPFFVAGLAALRSRVFTVVDALAALGHRPGASSKSGHAIILQSDAHFYALLVDEVEDVLEHDGEVRPVRGALGGGWSRVSLGMVEANGELFLLVDAKALLSGPEAVAA